METREQRLLPGGVPRWIRCYDNGGTDDPNGSIDRYTVVFTGRFKKWGMPGRGVEWPYLAMDSRPMHPQGFGQHGVTNGGPADTLRGERPPAIGRKGYLGRRIAFADLPPDCRTVALSDYRCIWGLCGPCADCGGIPESL